MHSACSTHLEGVIVRRLVALMILIGGLFALTACSGDTGPTPAPSATAIGGPLAAAGWTPDPQLDGTGADILLPLTTALGDANYGPTFQDDAKGKAADAFADQRIRDEHYLVPALDAPRLRGWINPAVPGVTIFTVPGDNVAQDTQLVLLKAEIGSYNSNLAGYVAVSTTTVPQLTTLAKRVQKFPHRKPGAAIEIGISDGHTPVANGFVGYGGLG